MALGTVVWRCPLCKRNASARFCTHPKASWSIVYYVDGKARWRKAARNKDDAQVLLNRINSELIRGSYREIIPIRFRELVDKFLRQDADVLFKPSTAEYYRERLNVLLPIFGSLLTTDITLERVKEYRASVLEAGHNPSTINKNVGVLRRVLNTGVELRHITSNPLLSLQRVPEQKRIMDFLTPREMVLLFRHSDEPYRVIFMIAGLAGLREGEVLGLGRDDLDWHNNEICVNRNLARYQDKEGRRVWKLTTPKSAAAVRRVPMPKELYDALQRHFLTVPENAYGLVFCTTQGTPLDPSNLIRREFKPALTRAGLRSIRFHDLRHSFVAMLLGLNVNLKVIQELLGHASIQTTMDIYGHLLPETKKQAVEPISGVLQEASRQSRVEAPLVCAASS